MKLADRLNLHLKPIDKAKIACAAELGGVSLASFVRNAVLREAEIAIASEPCVLLSRAASRRFIAALDGVFAPSPKLKKAMDKGLVRRQ